jgi:hypothetical protein
MDGSMDDLGTRWSGFGDELWRPSGTALAGSTGPNVDWLYVVMMVSRPASLGPNMAVTQRTLALGVPLHSSLL